MAEAVETGGARRPATWAGAGFGLALAWVWLASLRICVDFGLISAGFWLRFGFGFILVWLDLASA